MPLEEKMRHADFSIDTSGSFEDVRGKTEKVYETLSALAAAG